ncbi:uncharacterized protein FIBRA_03636 [Fibroporia radiculosa]|uniref:Patatin-like phospholipase domain-containing protein n=1 Tax=Fibroporia radiculosa TaxID=599839 RepID=J4I9Q6_9APHY|nr:uncharacterized protein FIBRA_03636 [Fibroporia radiculosa]CCM01576.1 predicted protein [Fibroporia radiculosa]
MSRVRRRSSIVAHRERELPSELDADYVDESHIQAFSQAINTEDYDLNDQPYIPSPSSPAELSIPASPRVRKISALSDFAPVNLRVKKRRRNTGQPQHKRQEWLYILVRWPLLSLIFLFMAVQFGMYVLIRQLVNAKEWLSAWRGRKGILRQRLRNARTYQEWKDAALVLDDHLQFGEWKQTEEDPFYDWRLVRKTFYGTKVLIEEYVTEQEKALEYIRESPAISNEEKKRFFKMANTNLGTSALCLSGGASFGYYHFGVVKAFLEAGLLPRVISGTSAGGVVAAVVCTRTDAEVKALLVPELARRITAFEEPFRVWIKRFWTSGARFDSLMWARKLCFFTRGSMTFREAYMRTGRILNISVVPADRHSPTKLLNYMTAPDTVIWSALLASAAVPGILNPVVLMQKLKDGSIVPWSWGSKFKDGSLRVDIPVQALNMYFNVTHPIVSQVNPHVHLFFFAPQGSAGKPVAHRKNKGWRGNFLLSAAEQWLKLELTKNFKLIRDLDLLPQVLGQDWSSVFLQRFEGSVTIWPRTKFSDWIHILSDPDETELERMMYVGQLVTWPKLHMIENRFRLEKQIFIGRQAVRRALHPRVQERSAHRSDATPQERVPVPNPDTKFPVTSSTPIGSAPSEAPLPVDTDVETAYFLNSIRDNKPVASGSNGTSSSLTSGHSLDPRRPSLRRRQLAPNPSRRVENDTAREERGGATPDPPPPPSNSSSQHALPLTRHASSSHVNPVEFLRRLGNGSITGSFSPFSSIRRSSKQLVSETLQDSMAEPTWSGDSSSDDDDLSILSRRQRHSSVFDIRSDLERRLADDGEF